MEKNSKRTLIQILTPFRWLIYILSGLIFVGLIVGLVAREIQTSRAEAAIRQIEDIEASYAEWKEEKEKALPDEITQKALGIIARYPHQYGSARAYQLLIDIAWEEQNYQEVAEFATKLADQFSSSHLVPASLYTAASAHEEQAEVEQALAQYQRLVENYPESFEAPQALFSIGRIQESMENYEDAADTYAQLFDKFASADWGRFAKDRLIYLQISGHIHKKENE